LTQETRVIKGREGVLGGKWGKAAVADKTCFGTVEYAHCFLPLDGLRFVMIIYNISNHKLIIFLICDKLFAKCDISELL